MKTKICTKCGKKKLLRDFYNNKRYKFNVESQCKVCREGLNKIRDNTIPAGVYAIYSKKNNECLYIGESEHPFRRFKKHKTDYLKEYKKNKEKLDKKQIEERINMSKDKSLLSQQVTLGNLDPNDFELILLEEVSTLTLREKRETYYQQKLKPKFNQQKDRSQ